MPRTNKRKNVKDDVPLVTPDGLVFTKQDKRRKTDMPKQDALIKCPLCLLPLDPLKREHGRIHLSADAVRNMEEQVHNITDLNPSTVPCFFPSFKYHSWNDHPESAAIVHTWCNMKGPHACMRKKKFRDGHDFCSGSIRRRGFW